MMGFLRALFATLCGLVAAAFIAAACGLIAIGRWVAPDDNDRRG